MRIAVLGAGLVGTRTASMVARSGEHDVILIAQNRQRPSQEGVKVSRGWPHPAAAEADVVVLATESARQFEEANQLINDGISVVATADSPQVIEQLLSLDVRARSRGATLVVGAAYSPGVSTLLATHLASGFDEVRTVATAQFGTGGPACAREHHRATSSTAWEVRRGQLTRIRGGSGRELVWFPDPIGAADRYRAGLADPLLLHRALPMVERIQSRQAATRRDRLTARLPMLRPPHREGLQGAVWAEVRGVVDGRVEHRAMAASGPQATGAAAFAAACCELMVTNTGLDIGQGDQSAKTPDNTVPLLRYISNYIGLWAYDSTQIVAKAGVSSATRVARKWDIAGKTG